MAAKRHHYVPVFLLDRFSEHPGGEGSLLWAIDKTKGGAPERASPENVAVISRFYEGLDEQGRPDNAAEEALSKIESYAAGLIRRLVEGEALGADERESLAAFAALAHFRAPLARQWIKEMASSYAKAQFRARALFEPAFDEIMEKVYPDMDMEERAELRAWTLEAFDDDRIDVEFPQTFTIAMVFRLSIELGSIFHDRMQWTYLRAWEPPQFIISDTPVAMYDPTGAPSAPLSSFKAETTLPLDPTLCLVLRRSSRRRWGQDRRAGPRR
jgi:hypothetical protein